MIRYSRVKYEDLFKPPLMSLFVISACNLQCSECIMMDQMHKHPAYQMSLEEMERFLYFTEKSGYSFNYRYTGGEPLYWKNLLEGTQMLRRSKSCKSILLMTNAMKHEVLTDDLVSMIDHIRISQYGYNKVHMKELKDRFPYKVHIVDRGNFYPHPTEPFEDAVPVECGNLEHLYFDGKVYACPHSLSLAIKNDMTHLEIGVDVGENYCDRNEEIRKGHVDICKLCIGNKKVRQQIDKISNISNMHNKLVQIEG